MPRLKPAKRLRLEFFWRAHLKGWRDSDLNQREYCGLHGLPLKRFGNWRATFKDEERVVPEGLLYRRGGGLRPRSRTRSKEIAFAPMRKRRGYLDDDKRRIIEEACSEGRTVSSIARKYGITTSLLFRWRKQLGMEPMHRIVPVTITDAPDSLADLSAIANLTRQPAPAIVDRTTPAIEVELAGGRRLRFERNTDPATIERLVALLEGASR